MTPGRGAQELEHLMRAQVERVQIAEKDTYETVVFIRESARHCPVQPVLRFGRLEAEVVFPRVVGRLAIAQPGITVLHPGFQRGRQRGHWMAMAQGIQHAVDKSLVAVIALGLAQQVVIGGRHVGGGQRAEGVAHPGLAPEPPVLTRSVAKRLQQRQSLSGAQGGHVAVQHNAQWVERDQLRTVTRLMHHQPGKQPPQGFDRFAIKALQQGQQPGQWQAAGQTFRQRLGGQELGNAAVAGCRAAGHGREHLAGQGGTCMAQRQNVW